MSVDETEGVIAALKARFPDIAGPRKEDICYATTNRQAAVKAIAGDVDALMVIGSANSSNSSRLVEVARAYGCDRSILVSRASDIDWRWFEGVGRLGLTAGASAPEVLVEEVVAEARLRFDVTTSLGFDLPRAALTVALVVVAGRAVLVALRRASRRAAFDASVVFEPASASVDRTSSAA